MTASALSLSISELAAAYRQGTLTPLEVVEACLAQIARTDQRLHAWVDVLADSALESARQAGDELARGIDRGPLHGVPVGIKDIFDVAGVPTRCGSPARVNTAPATIDSASVAALRRGGAMVLGKTVTQEFAAGVISPPARNAWDPQRIPGGSSGGSATALAARNCFAAMGSDTGGSIRIPASVCGVVGFKPTYGTLSADGVFPLSWSLDTVGPLTRNVDDAYLTWALLAGQDPVPPPERSLAGLRIGLPGPFFVDHLQSDVRRAYSATADTLRDLGAEVIEAPWPEAAAARGIGFILNRAETAAVHGDVARRDPEAFAAYNPDLRLRVAAGGILPSELYVNALRQRAFVRDSVARVFAGHRLDAMLAPATPTTAVLAADMRIIGTGLDEGIGAAWTRLTMPFNATGQPVLSVPAGLDGSGLPIGMQLAGAPGREDLLFQIGRALETALDLRGTLPRLLIAEADDEVQT